MEKKKRSTKRRGPKHPGVVLLAAKPERRIWHRARYIDPDTGLERYETLERDLTTVEQREAWAVDKAKDLAKRKIELERGASRFSRSPLKDAIESYYKVAENRLRDGTVDTYTRATDLFQTWATARGITTTDQLTAAKLPGFVDYLHAQRKKAYVTGSKRGARTDGTERLSPVTINVNLRAVKTVLNHLRLRGAVPVGRDAISDALKPVKALREAPEFMRPAELVQAIKAAMRHDAETVISREEESELRKEARAKGITRLELAKVRPNGTTPRYEPIAPFLAVTLLTGMRFGEALALRWDSVDLDAVDADGKKVGEIRLKGTETKTGFARTIGLDVSPSLHVLLSAMKLKAGDDVYVFGGKNPWPKTSAEAARRRLTGAYGAPKHLTWQILRSTCATYQCNAPSLFGAAAAFLSAKRLGHSVTVSEKHYAGLFAVSREARTLEACMQIEDQTAELVKAVSTTRRKVRAA